MFDKPGFIRFLATLLLGALIVCSILGIVRWNEVAPPNAPDAGRFILGVCGLSSLFGLGVLWTAKPEA